MHQYKSYRIKKGWIKVKAIIVWINRSQYQKCTHYGHGNAMESPPTTECIHFESISLGATTSFGVKIFFESFKIKAFYYCSHVCSKRNLTWIKSELISPKLQIKHSLALLEQGKTYMPWHSIHNHTHWIFEESTYLTIFENTFLETVYAYKKYMYLNEFNSQHVLKI